MPGSAREEAERLVATILARTTSAAGGTSGDGFGLLGESVAGLIGVLGRDDLSTGSAECCVCPVCKAIAAVRDPSPETAERLAASAGEIAGGVAGLMRAFSSMAGERPRTPTPRGRSAPASSSPDRAWSAATRTTDVADEPPAPDAGSDPWGAASAADAREAAAAARARAAAAEEAVARAVAQATKARAAAAAQEAAAKARAAGTPDRGATGPVPGGSRTGGDVWAMATSEVAASDPAEPRSVDHELGASVPEDREPGQGDDARPGTAV
jgi:hypothetical protein